MGKKPDKNHEVGKSLSGYYTYESDKWMGYVDVENKRFKCIFSISGEYYGSDTWIDCLPARFPKNYIYMGPNPTALRKYKLEVL